VALTTSSQRGPAASQIRVHSGTLARPATQVPGTCGTRYRSLEVRGGSGCIAEHSRRRDCSRMMRRVVETPPVTLRDVAEVAPAATRVIAEFERDFAAVLARAEVHHIGATSLPFGHTKGDVDVNVRVAEDQFSVVVTAFHERLTPAQPENWSRSFASFSAEGYELPLGVQVTSIDSEDDFLLELRDRMRADPSLLRRYDDIKVAAASKGTEGYWKAKDTLIRQILSDCARGQPGRSR
jgi:GrpB-like predicted nucleotidyltransferase (UPF0157 family)